MGGRHRLPSRWWVSILCLRAHMSALDMGEAVAALCESHYVLADYPEQMALPLDLRLAYEVSAGTEAAAAGCHLVRAASPLRCSPSSLANSRCS